MLITLITLLGASVFFVIGKVRSDVVALCALAVLLAAGIVTPAEALAGFSNSAVVMMVGLFVVGGALFQTGLARIISGKLLKLAGTSEKRLFFLVVLVTASVAAFVSNTGTVALLLPIVLAMAKTARVSPSQLLMPLAFASSMGGILTLIGTPPNLIVDEYLRNGGYEGFSFFDFTPIGLICLAVGLILLYPLCRLFLKRRGDASLETDDERTPSELLHDYHVDDYLFRLELRDRSPLEGQTLREVDLHHRYGLTLLEVRRAHVGLTASLLSPTLQELATPDTLFATGDTLYVLGHRDAVERFAADYHVQVHHDEERGDRCKLDFYEIGLAELLLTPGSSLVGRPLRAANFRERFGVSILALKRRRQYLFDNIQDEILRPGDMMLVHGAWKSIESLAHKRREWLVVGRPLETAEHVTLDHKAPLAAVIMALMVFFMVFDVLPVAPVGIVIIAALLMVLTGCMRSVDAAYKSIGWESIVLIAAMMPMSTALEKTGVSAQVSEAIVTGLGTYGPLAALAGVYAATSLLSTFISNSATAILVAPIAMQTAAQMGVDPAPFLMTAAVAASACFAAPISTPPNAMVMSAGRYTFMDYVKVGVPLQIAIGVVAIFAIPLLFPF